MSRPLAVRRVAKVRRLLNAKAKAGKVYSRAYALTAELLNIAPVGTEIVVNSKTYVVVDNFAGRVAFKVCKIDRFEVKEAKPEKAPR